MKNQMTVALRITLFACAIAVPLPAQVAPATGRLEFEVASVKPNNSDNPQAYSTFPLGPGDVYVDSGGLFSATNYPLVTYIAFAYKIMGNQIESFLGQLPGWVSTDRFDIQARATGHPTKDQMRLMMRALLADRFKLAIHSETRQVPVFLLSLIKPGKPGPQLQAHPANYPCSTVAPQPPAAGSAPVPPPSADEKFPALCGGLLPIAHGPGRVSKFGARNVTIPFIANQLAAMGGLGRPVVDETGLRGTFDFALEWAPEVRGPQTPDATPEPESPAPTFLNAVKEQLGLKLESQKRPEEVLVFDRVEHPSDN
jgi:uncharacterized protein (TIGR03435 family)